ncbi:MAG: DUF2027 domain-containing protein [Prevotellaceae bacterium]|jgi:hypothetical protein|nr:DUF2027 domain-containing protein [Prevotellaceae bacterium]
MNCKIGDKVRFLNSVGGGIVARIDGKTVYVRDEDGFEMPSLASDIVVVNNARETTNFPMDTPNNSKVEAPVPFPIQQEEPVKAKSTVRDQQGDTYEVFIAFTEPESEKTELYLLNDSTYQCFYNVGFNAKSEVVNPLGQGIAEPDSKTFIKLLYLSELRDVKTLRIELAFFKNIEFRSIDPEVMQIELNPIKFFKKGVFQESDFFDKHTLIYKVLSNIGQNIEPTKDVLPSAEQIKEVMPEKNKPLDERKDNKSEKQPNVKEIDLRAKVLIPNVDSLSPNEILEQQLSRFTNVMEDALKSGYKGKLVFVHGIGNGKLKQDIRNRLTKDYKELHFQDASYREYEYGATMIFF